MNRIALELSDSRALEDRGDDTIAGRFERQAASTPDKLALVTEGETYTYRELDALATDIALRLASLPWRPDRPIALLLPERAILYASILAVTKAGRIFIIPELQAPEIWLRNVIEDSGTACILTAGSLRDLVSRIAPESVDVLDLDDLPRGLSEIPPVRRVSPDAVAYILYTSGSTGRPKGVAITHRCYMHRLAIRIVSQCVTPDDRIAHIRPTGYGAGLYTVLMSFLSGACLYRFDLRSRGLNQFARWLDDNQITNLAMTGSFLRTWLASLPENCTFPSLRVVTVGAEPFYGTDLERIGRHLGAGWRVVHNFSSSETGTMAFEWFDSSSKPEEGVMPVGQPAMDKQIRIEDENRNPVARGEIGEIVVKSRFLASGYWNNKTATEAVFGLDPSDGIPTYRTGDLGRWREDGRLEHAGRKNRKVKLRGYTVELHEVETAVFSIASISDAAVSVVDDGTDHAFLVVYAVAKGPKAQSAQDIQAEIARRLPAHMVPAHVVMLDSLPLTSRGKLDRNALPRVDRNSYPTGGRPPATETERRIARIWKEQLGKTELGAGDNFFEIGGTSLQAFMIFSRINRELGHDLPPTAMVEAPTIALQAALLERKDPAGNGSKLVAFRKHGSRSPLFLVHAGFGDIAYGFELTRHMKSDRPIYGLSPPPLDGTQRIGRTLEAIAAGYLAEIRAVQPKGPYFLGGHSFGGWVAFEMACQLERQNETAAFVGLIDTYAKSTPKYRETAAPRLTRHVNALRRNNLGGMAEYLRKHAVKNAAFGMAMVRHTLLEKLPRNVGIRLISPPSYATRPDLYRRIFQRASRSYAPRVFGGSIAVFSAKGMADAHRTHWAAHIRGEVTVVEFAAGHHSIVWPPHSEKLAGAFDDLLARASAPA